MTNSPQQIEKKITYQVTKKQCQEQIDKANNVCDRCGRKIVPIKTVNNGGEPTYWAGCFHGDTSKGAWGNFTHGVKKEIYDLAYKLVLDDSLTFGMKKREDSDFDYLFESAVSHACGIIDLIEYMKIMKEKLRYTKEELEKDYKKYHKSL
jgi:hypothetical protein